MNYFLPLIAFSLLISFNVSKAQITAVYFPAADTILMSSANSNIQITAGGDGPGQVWNFSEFMGTQIDSVVFTDPVTAGYGTDFPNANRFQDEPLDQDSYSLPTAYNIAAEGAYQVGMVLNPPINPLPVPIEPELLWMPFPSNLGTAFKDTAFMTATVLGSQVGMPSDSVRFERTIYRSDTISASGSLQLSSGYYPNVLRKTTTDLWWDSIYAYTTGDGWQFVETDQRESITHYWIDPSLPFALAELNYEDEDQRAFRARPFDPGPISYYLEFVGMTQELTEGEMYPPFSVNIRNVSNNLLASGYSTDSIRVSAIGYINGNLAEWPVSGISSFDSVFTYNGGNARFIAYGFECLADTFDVHIVQVPDSLRFVGLANQVDRTDLLPTFEVHAYNYAQEGSAQLNTEYEGVVNIGKKSGAGAISGTVSKPLINGVATFEDIHFNYADDYELIAYFINVDNPDTATVSVVGEQIGDWYFNRVDTLSKYIDRATWFVWWGGNAGIVSGPSRIPKWTEIGQHFDFDGSGRITEVMLHASSYENVHNDEDSIQVSFYDAGVNQLIATDLNPLGQDNSFYVDSLAKHLLGSTYIREDTLSVMMTSELFTQRPMRWALDEPIEVHGPFVMAVKLNYLETNVNDTLILWHSEIGDGLGENRNSRRVINNESGFADNEWLPEYMARAVFVTDYDYMFEPILEVDSFQTSPPVGINDIGEESSFLVYPSLAKDFISLRQVSFSPSCISILNALGEEVAVVSGTEIGVSPYYIDVTNLAAGVYFVKLIGVERQKIAVEKFIKG